MHFQIASDLHIEYKNDDKVDVSKYIIPSAQVLILAGDIGSFYKYDQLNSFLEDVSKLFKYVIYIPGNHEYYTPPLHTPLTYKVLTERLNTLAKSCPNVITLNRGCVQLGDDICIAGATLWSNIQCPLPKYIIKIHQMTSDQYKELFVADLTYITDAIQHCKDNNLKLICVTHHPPTRTVFHSTNKKRLKLQSLYVSDLDHLLDSSSVHTWVCGHVHENFNFITPGGCRLVGNQSGKPKDNITDYSKEFVIEV